MCSCCRGLKCYADRAFGACFQGAATGAGPRKIARLRTPDGNRPQIHRDPALVRERYCLRIAAGARGDGERAGETLRKDRRCGLGAQR